MIKIRLFDTHPGVYYAGPRGGATSPKYDPNPCFAIANRLVLGGMVKDGMVVLETEAFKHIIANSFTRDHFPLVIRLALLYQQHGFLGFTPERKEAISSILLQASDVSSQLTKIAAEDPAKLMVQERFHLGAGFSAQAVSEKLNIFSESVDRLLSQIDKPVEPLPPPAPKPKPEPQPVPAPKPAPEPKPAPAPAPEPAPAPQPAPVPEPVLAPSPAPSPVPALSPKEKAISAVKSGLGQLGNKSFKAAFELFKAALTADPGNTDAQDGLDACAAGLIALAEKQLASTQLTRLTSAATYLKQAKEAKPKEPGILKRIEALEKILTPGTSTPLSPELKPASAASASADKIIPLASIPAEITALVDFIFVCANDISRTDEMLVACVRLIDSGQRPSIAFAQLGWCFFKRGQYDQAHVLFNYVLSRWPNDRAAQAGSSAVSGRVDTDAFDPLTEKQVLEQAKQLYITLIGPQQAAPAPAAAPAAAAPTVPAAPEAARMNPRAQKLLGEARYLLLVNVNLALEKLLQANAVEPNHPEILVELNKLFDLFKDRAVKHENRDRTAAIHACKQALKIKPQDPELLALLGSLEHKAAAPPPSPAKKAAPAPDLDIVIRRPSPAPLPSGPAPLSSEERLKRLLAIFKNRFAQKDYAKIIQFYEDAPKTIGNNFQALCYYCLARLAVKFPLLPEQNRPSHSGPDEVKRVSKLFFRLRNFIKVIETLVELRPLHLVELKTKDMAVFNLIINVNRIVECFYHAKVIAGLEQDPALTEEFYQRTRKDFEEAIVLEITLETSEQTAARKKQEKEKHEAAKLEQYRQEAIQYFVLHPDAKHNDLPGSIWATFYRRKLFPGGIEQARELAKAGKIE